LAFLIKMAVWKVQGSASAQLCILPATKLHQCNEWPHR